MVLCGYIYEPRPKPKPHRFKVPIPSWAWFSRGTVRQAQRFGYIAAWLVSNPSGEEPRPPQAAHIKWSKFKVDLMKILNISNFTNALP